MTKKPEIVWSEARPSSRSPPSSFAASAAPLFLESRHQLQCILVINFPQHLIRQLKSIDPPERVPLSVVLEILVARLQRPKIPLVFIHLINVLPISTRS